MLLATEMTKKSTISKARIEASGARAKEVFKHEQAKELRAKVKKLFPTTMEGIEKVVCQASAAGKFTAKYEMLNNSEAAPIVAQKAIAMFNKVGYTAKKTLRTETFTDDDTRSFDSHYIDVEVTWPRE